MLPAPINESKSSSKKRKYPRRPNGYGSVFEINKDAAPTSGKSKICKWRGQYTDYLSPKSPKPRPTKNFKTKVEAERWLNERVTELQRGFSSSAIDSKITVKDFVERFINQRESRGRSPETIRSYRSNLLNHIGPRIGHLNASKLSTHAIESMFGDMRKEGLGRTAGISYAILSAAYKYAMKMGDIGFNPMERIEKPRCPAQPTQPIPWEDFQKIYKAASLDPYSHARAEVALVIGIRPSEALALKWSDLELDSEHPFMLVQRKLQRVKGEGLVFGPTKTGKAIVKPLSSDQVKIFKRHRNHQYLKKASWNKDHDLVFPNSLGQPMDDKADTKLWIYLLKLAGVDHFQRYQARKSAFSYLAPFTDPKTLQTYSGHSQISTLFNHYVHTMNPSMTELIRAQDSIRQKISGPVSGEGDQMTG